MARNQRDCFQRDRHEHACPLDGKLIRCGRQRPDGTPCRRVRFIHMPAMRAARSDPHSSPSHRSHPEPVRQAAAVSLHTTRMHMARQPARENRTQAGLTRRLKVSFISFQQESTHLERLLFCASLSASSDCGVSIPRPHARAIEPCTVCCAGGFTSPNGSYLDSPGKTPFPGT